LEGETDVRPVVYARVSTDQQETAQQRESCVQYARAKAWEDPVVIEESASAWKGPRPKWESLKQDLRAGKYRVLIVFRIDRLWRRSSEFCLDIEEFNRRGVAVVSILEGLDASTPIGHAMLNVIVALGQLERTWIAEATKDRLQALRNLGKRLGPPMRHPMSDEAIYAKYRELGGIRATAAALGVSLGKVHKVVHNPPVEKADVPERN